jgi:hypothetical protein
MDCLDRTNVVQSTLAKRVLEKQLRSIGILNEGEGIDGTDLMPIFRNGKCLSMSLNLFTNNFH